MKQTQVIAAVLMMALAGGLLAAGCGVDQAREAGERAAGQGGRQESGSGEGSGAGSGESGENAQQTPTEPSTTPEPSLPEETTGSEGITEPLAEVPESTVGGTTEPSRVLEDKWYIDSDNNEVPDFIETELGYDPEVDDCAQQVNCPGPSGASGTSAVDFVSTEQNTLLILDSSGSMAEPIGGGQTKMEAARDSLERYATATPDFINLGFMVYGHEGSNEEADRAESCEGVEVLEQPGEVDYETFPDTLQSFEPTGWTPIAGSLQKAGEAFSGQEEATNRVILVSDGLETCGGDPVAAAQQLADSDVQVTIDVVGFDVPEAEEEQLRRIAEVSGGNYATADSAEELQDYFEEQEQVWSELFDQWSCVQGANLDLDDCYLGFALDTNDLMLGIALDDNNDERYAVMIDIQESAYEYNINVQEEAWDQGEKRLEEIDEDMEEVEERMEESYNEDVSYTPSCPGSTVYASLGGDDVPSPVVAALLAPGPSGSSGT